MNRAEILAQMRRASSWRTICEVHREIYDECAEVPEPARSKIRDLVMEAFDMGKKMDSKLRFYKYDWDVGFYESNADHKADSIRRKA